MRFQKYSKIENSYRPEFIERIRLEGKDGVSWIATEKLHGANFSIWVNATNTKIAKRTGWLGDGTKFFNVSQIVPELKLKAQACFRYIKVDYPEMKEVVICGELCGGSYPHPKVAKSSRFKTVQGGVWYSPKLEFLVFDIRKDGNYMSTSHMEWYATASTFDVVPIVGHGTFEEVMKIRNDYVSKAYKMFGLPIIKQNVMEGLVIRPVHSSYLRRGERVILKTKNSKYAEKNTRKPKRPVKLTGFRKKFATIALSMVNANRYDAVVSKVGDVEPRDFNKILGLIIQDIHSDIIDEQPKLYMQFQDLDKTERKLIHQVLAPEVAVIIREKLLGIKVTK